MRKIHFQVTRALDPKPAASFAEKNTREKMARTIADRLAKEIRIRDISHLKSKHINLLVQSLKTSGPKGKPLRIGTMKNYLAQIRRMARGIGKPQIVHSKNSHYGIGKRTTCAEHSKAQRLTQVTAAQIKIEWVQLAARLAGEFGMRAEESLKFQVELATAKGNDHVYMLGSWCKNGRGRFMQIETQAQRQLLEEIKQFTSKSWQQSMIPQELSYVQAQRKLRYELGKFGIKPHGLRHNWAQEKYRSMIGMEPPVCGGLKFNEMSREQRDLASLAYQVISDHLGHSRKYVASHYLGGRY